MHNQVASTDKGELSAIANTGSAVPVEGCCPHRPEDEMPTAVEDPNIIYGVAEAPRRLR